MNIDLLSPEFIAFAEEVKKLYAEKEQKVAAFKEVWLKHKAEVEALEQKAEALKQSLCAGQVSEPAPQPQPIPGPDGGVAIRRAGVKK